MIPIDPAKLQPEDGAALCLSGGGYRAMLFHAGALWRLYEADMLRGLKRISSVSGGSITAAVLGLHWHRLSFDPARPGDDFVRLVIAPLRKLASKTIDAPSIILGLATPDSVSNRIAKAYDRHLFHGSTLQDLPDAPRFVINAANVQSGALWRFMKPYTRDWRVGEIRHPRFTLAQAVAASSAFPPMLSPLKLRIDPRAYTPGSGAELQREPYTSRVVLSDGGVYDNLGLETAWKRYKTVLVSDGGGALKPEERPKRDWGRHAYRVLNLIDNQVRSLRKRQLIESYKFRTRDGAYWGIRTDIRNYGAGKHFECPLERTLDLAETPTRLKRLDDERQERLINWGYAVCDATLRAHANPGLAHPASLPYPSRGI